jgi:hypothetical protein
VNSERWNSFTAFAERLLGKPTFDLEERAARLQVAAELVEALGEASEETASAAAARVFAGPRLRGSDLAPLGQALWFVGWLASEDPQLGNILERLTDPEGDPLERFDAFMRAYESAAGAGRAAPNPAAAAGMAALLNFAADPERLPVVRERPFQALREMLGAEPVPDGMPVERYRSQLDFARSVERGLREAGVAVRDMLDTQALMLLAVRNRGFWLDPDAVERPAPARAREPDVYLSACAIYRDEAPYLREWIEFHRLVGVERFFLYDNLSVDDHMTVLEPYIERGIVHLEDWPMTEGAQIPAYEHCIREHAAESRWIAIIDIDEFLFSPAGRRLDDLLVEYERWPAVGVNWAVFGPSGHERKPPGLVIENYSLRLRTDATQMATKTIKSIVDPARVARTTGVHCQVYDRLGAVDENHYPIPGGRTKSVSFERLRINHYFTKSLEEFQRLGTRVGQNPRKGRRRYEIALSPVWEDETVNDEAILQYLPALRETVSAKSVR